MKTYIVIADTVRQPFDPRMFRKGEVIELDDKIKPGGCFKLQESSAPEKEEKDPSEGVNSLSGLQKKQKDDSDPKSGFAKKEEPKKEEKSKKSAKTK